jgi:hypothetical protein
MVNFIHVSNTPLSLIVIPKNFTGIVVNSPNPLHSKTDEHYLVINGKYIQDNGIGENHSWWYKVALFDSNHKDCLNIWYTATENYPELNRYVMTLMLSTREPM